MDQNAHDAQEDREQTREALTQKIELLEERVRDSVEEARTLVKQRLRLSYHVERRPWQMLGLSLLAGFFIGRIVGKERGRGYAEEPPMSTESRFFRGRNAAERDGMSAVKGAAAGIVTSVAVQLVKEGLAAAASKVKSSRRGRRGKEFSHGFEHAAAERSFDRDFQ